MEQQIKQLEERIKKLEANRTATIMSDNADKNIMRSVQRSLAMTSLALGSAIPRQAAILDIASIRQGVCFPNMTTAQRDAIINPLAGLVIFNTTTGVLNFHNGSAWGAV